MPAGAARAPWRVPGRLAGLGALPQGEVERVALVRVDLDPGAGPQLGQGAAGLADLGHHFPSGDPRWKAVSGIELCRQVAELVAASGWVAVNLDVTVLCDRPRLGHLTTEMAANLAAALGLEPAQVRVTAKGTDGLGFPGRGQGIAATAVCLAAAGNL